jgi:hypothetical protein
VKGDNYCIYRGDCCTDVCLSRRRDTENDIQKLKWDLQNKEDKVRQLEKEVQVNIHNNLPWFMILNR